MDASQTTLPRTLLALPLVTLMALTACAEEPAEETPAESAPADPSAATPEGDGEEQPESDDDGAEEGEDGLERTEELGAFFSEEEACMTIGSTVKGLQADAETGFDSQEELDAAADAVGQTHTMAPDHLQPPLAEISEVLEAPYEEVDTGAVLAELEPLQDWVDATCEEAPAP